VEKKGGVVGSSWNGEMGGGSIGDIVFMNCTHEGGWYKIKVEYVQRAD